MDCSKSEKSQDRKLPSVNRETESLTEKEKKKNLFISHNSGIKDDIPYDETSSLISNRLQGVCSSPISLPSSSIRLYSKLDATSGRTGSLSPTFQFTNDLSVSQSSEIPTESLLPSVKKKDDSNDEIFETSLVSTIVDIYPNHKNLRVKALDTRNSPKTPKNPRKFTTQVELLDEFQPSKKTIEIEDNQLVEESSKNFTPARLQNKEILELERSSRSLTRKRKLLADDKSAHHSENGAGLKQKKQSKFKRRRICKDISEGNTSHDKLDSQAGISLNNDVSEDARVNLPYSKTCSNHNSKDIHGGSKNRTSCGYHNDTRYSENDEYTKIYENSTQTQIIQPNRSPIITRNVSLSLKKASTLEKCKKKRSPMKNSSFKKKNDKNTQIISTSLTKVQQQQKLKRFDMAEDDEFESDPTDTTVIEASTDKVILSNSSINPKENKITNFHQTNNKEIQITKSNSTTATLNTTTTNKTSTNRKHQDPSSDSKNTPKNLQNPPIPLPLPNHNKFCRDIILGKLDLLISAINQADLRKGDVSLIEDKMMDAKRALYEAERRSRSS